MPLRHHTRVAERCRVDAICVYQRAQRRQDASVCHAAVTAYHATAQRENTRLTTHVSRYFCAARCAREARDGTLYDDARRRAMYGSVGRCSMTTISPLIGCRFRHFHAIISFATLFYAEIVVICLRHVIDAPFFMPMPMLPPRLLIFSPYRFSPLHDFLDARR